jgi:tetratricopeptide (TPR) repeat protein
MSEAFRSFVSLIPTWVTSTQDVDIPPQPDKDGLDRSVLDLRGRLRDGSWAAFDLVADDQGLAVLSRLCFELSKPITVGELTGAEAAAAYDLVSKLIWSSDLFEERNEVLSQLALVAWRQSRQRGTTETMVAWERKYRVAFSRPSAERASLEQFLTTEEAERSDELAEVISSDVRLFFGLCELLREYCDSRPARALTEASFLFKWVSERGHIGLENERTYFLGILALIAGTGSRFMGLRESASRWFERAHCFLSKLRNSEPELAKLAYARFALGYELRQYEVIVRDVPFLLVRCRTLALEEIEIKCLFLEGAALKECGKHQEALAKFLDLEERLRRSDPCRLLGGVLCRIGELYSARGWHRGAMQKYQQALPLLRESGRPSMVADLKGTVGETCRDMGKLTTAIDLYREAISDYAELSMVSLAAYLRVVLAETLLLAGRPREAEIEILAALPTIEAEQMAEERFAALKLLRKALERNKLDAASVQALRESLKGDQQ